MSATPIKLIVGLGNPGSEYRDTRHNVGFWLVDRLARRYGSCFRDEAKFSGAACRVSIEGRSLWLLKPLTFMNHSGRAVGQLARFYKLTPENLLVAHDELDLPPGAVRLKSGGGHGGHNGLRDIIAQLGGRNFVRLRLGIGHPGDSRAVTGYVLRRAPIEQREQLEQAVDQAIKVLPLVLAGDLTAAMNTLHRPTTH